MTAFEERPHSPYYGSVDATPLYVVLLDEYERWTGDVKLVRELEYEARAALAWIDEYADLMGDGYIWYKRRNEKTGLENQCWKDSWDSISYHDGTLPGFPRATCELQGYAYDAKMRGARLARLVWKDPAFADKLEKQAANLKRRLNRDFWVEEGGYYALARDTDGRKVDALASNNGHLLWSGIADKSKAKSVARHLMSARLYSGWGVRTLAEGEGRYNPIGYHVGTVWPFDNSIAAWGLRRRHPRRRQLLRRPPARGVRRLPEGDHQVPGAVPHVVQPAGVVHRGAAPSPAHDARPRADRRAPGGRPGAAARDRTARAARHPRALGPRGRLRPRPRRLGQEASGAEAARRAGLREMAPDTRQEELGSSPGSPDSAAGRGGRSGGVGRPAALAFSDCLAQQVLDLRVDAAQLVRGPLLDIGPHFGVDAQQELLASGHGSAPLCRRPHVYSVPVLTTGVTWLSPHSTTMRLLTMAALRSSSNSTILFLLKSSRAISTMLTAPVTILRRAAMTASACCRRSIA